MTTEEIRDLIDETIDGEALALYLSAEHGDRFGVYPDGSVAVGEGIGDEIDPEERPVVWVECPGIGNLDMGPALAPPGDRPPRPGRARLGGLGRPGADPPRREPSLKSVIRHLT
jgi:hypothetical protein